MTQNLRLWCATSVVCLVTAAAWADDLNPPDYRGEPLSVEAHWNFDTMVTFDNDLPPDMFNSVGGSGGETLYNNFSTHIDFSPSGWAWDPMGSLLAVGPNASFAINAQNWVDLLPLKMVRVQITYKGQAPDVVEGTGVELAGTDNQFDFPGMEVGSFDDGLGNLYEDWIFEPNPDWEQLVVNVPLETLIDQVDFDSISVPEPTTLLGGLLGAAFLLTVRRRTR